VTSQSNQHGLSTPDGPIKDPDTFSLWTEVVKRGKKKNRNKKNDEHRRILEYKGYE
jgi:hypothetical protein